MDERTFTLILFALLLIGGVGLLTLLWYLYRPKKKKGTSKPLPVAPPSSPPKVIGHVKLTKRERMQRSLDTLEVAARWSKTLYGPSRKPAPDSYVALFRVKGEKHQKAITAQVKRWLAEG